MWWYLKASLKKIKIKSFSLHKKCYLKKIGYFSALILIIFINVIVNSSKYFAFLAPHWKFVLYCCRKTLYSKVPKPLVGILGCCLILVSVVIKSSCIMLQTSYKTNFNLHKNKYLGSFGLLLNSLIPSSYSSGLKMKQVAYSCRGIKFIRISKN